MSEQRRYKTILADPPWKNDQLGNYGAINHYQLLTAEQIKSMPVANLAEENAHLYLWATNSTVRAAYEVAEAWGFTARSLCCWLKPRLGLGNYFRLCNEHFLFCTRGKAPVKFKAQPNWFFAARQGHSHKPEEQFAIIERMSHGPYLELFARRRQPGWDAWGNETPGGSDVKLEGFPVPEYSEKYKSNKEGGDHE